MKILSTAIKISFVLFSASVFANQPTELQVLQNACQTKQVKHQCSVDLPNKSYEGTCVDAKRYELICVE